MTETEMTSLIMGCMTSRIPCHITMEGGIPRFVVEFKSTVFEVTVVEIKDREDKV